MGRAGRSDLDCAFCQSSSASALQTPGAGSVSVGGLFKESTAWRCPEGAFRCPISWEVIHLGTFSDLSPLELGGQGLAWGSELDFT